MRDQIYLAIWRFSGTKPFLLNGGIKLLELGLNSEARNRALRDRIKSVTNLSIKGFDGNTTLDELVAMGEKTAGQPRESPKNKFRVNT